MRHTFSVLVENKFGVLARVAGLFSGRGFNIDSLTVSPTHDESLSKMTIVTSGDDAVLEQIDKQLNKLVNVLKVTDLTGSGFVGRELMMIKVKARGAKRSEVIEVTNIFKGSIIHVETDALIVEITGRSEKLDAFTELMRKFGIVELARTGKVAMARASKSTEEIDVTPSYMQPRAD
jgi:acetolactate synthase-1/3 small subunit